ncbi:hypothetical protein CRG98_019605 [Punica granatum]|uniref:PB1 domain-containing protein n=1 Tax=Punica granatum TaxID=22663 RepID=A0A2I0JUM3_PUNGR|nr:hypothetical protein CRG98_019605 [Punica granatum]
MDPPPPPVTPLPAVNAAATESLDDDSPRSRAAVDGLAEEPLPPKLRLMCSYGGHIIPRPHDKSLCYVGGETRMVVVDRNSSLADLSVRLSQSLLNGRPFTLKYQLPNEDLDSLITVSTDEDLDNMIDEYDRTASVSHFRPSRLRVFLFFKAPETAMTMGALLEDAKSETWFVDALNNAMALPRGFSDSATMGGLMNLDRVVNSGSSTDLEAQAKPVHEVHSMPGSPMVENNSSYGSSSSSPSMSNLPPISVRVADQDTGARPQDQRVGIEEQFVQSSIAPPPNMSDGFGLLSGPPPTIPSGVVPGNSNVASAAMSVNQTAASGENVNRGMSDDERSDQGVPLTFRKPPLPLQPVQMHPVQQKAAGLYNLPSPDSVASDSSIASASSLSRPVILEDQTHAHSKDQRGQASPTLKEGVLDPTLNLQIPQLQEPAYMIPPQTDQPQQQQQQQFVQMSTHYIPHHATNPVLIPPYYHPIYATQSQQQLHHHPINQQQQPVYVFPFPQAQPYNMSVQPNVADNSSALASSRPPPSPSPTIIHSSGYKDTNTGPPQIYSTKSATQMKPEISNCVGKRGLAFWILNMEWTGGVAIWLIWWKLC